MSQPTPELPLEVADEWRRLHEEAQARYDDLAPPVRRGVLVAVIAAAFIILLCGGWGVNTYYFQPREAIRQAQATADALALDQEATARASAQAATATAAFLMLDSEAAARATAQAATDAAVALTQAASVAAQQTAVAATATANFLALRCQDIRLYTLAVDPEPILFPRPGTVHVIGNPPPAVYATWIVTNTGECPWEAVELKPLAGGEAVEPMLRRDGKPVARVEPGERVEVVLRFSVWAAEDVDEEWVVKVGDFHLYDQSHLWLEVHGWIITVPPTPTPTPTFTPTPVPPTDTPVPPTDTPRPPTDTPRPPTDTPVPPTNTPVPPTDTPLP